MYEQLLNRIESYLRSETDFLLPVKKVWLDVLNDKEKEKVSVSELVKSLESDDRFKILGNFCDDKTSKELSSENSDLHESLEAKGFFPGPRVWLKERTPSKDEIFKLLLHKSQSAIDALVQAWDYRKPEDEDQLIEVMQEMKKLQDHLRNVFSVNDSKPQN